MIGSAILSRGVAAAVLALVGVSAASATESGFYVGGNYGRTEFDASNSLDFSTAFNVTTSSTADDSDSMWSVAVGYRFNRAFALEVSYLDFGEATFSKSGNQTGTTPPTQLNIVGRASAKGTALAAVAALPIGDDWEISVRLGVFRAKTELQAALTGQTTTAPITPISQTLDGSATTNEALAGLGVGYTFADHFHVRLDLNAFPTLGDGNKTGTQDVTTLTAGFAYRF